MATKITPVHEDDKEREELEEELKKVEEYIFELHSISFPSIETEVEDEYYNKIGFHSSYSNLDNNEHSVIDVISNHKRQLQDDLTKADALKEDTLAEIDRKILRLEEIDNELDLRYKQEKGKTPDLIKQADELKKDIEELRKEITTTYLELGKRKGNHVNEQIKTARDEVNQVIDTLDIAYDKKYKIHEKDFNRNKSFHEQNNKTFQKILNSLENGLTNINKKIELLNTVGINRSVSKILLNISYFAALVGGWLFSVLVTNLDKETNFNSDSPLFFFVNGFFSFAREVLSLSDNVLFSGLYLLLVLLVFIILTTGIVTIAFFFLKKEGGVSEIPDEYALNVRTTNDSKTVENSIDIKSKTFIGFWLKLMPKVFIVGIVFIILAIGSSSSQIDSLDNSLAGQFAGIILTLLGGGISFLYITKVIEPRLEKQGNNLSVKNLIIYNIELLAILVFYFVTTTIILFGYDYFKNNISMMTILPFISFSICAIFTSFLFSYSLRYIGLLSTQSEFRNNIIAVSNHINHVNRPIPLQIEIQDHQFKEKFYNIGNALYSLIEAKLVSGSEMVSKRNYDEKEHIKNNDKNVSLFRKFVSLFDNSSDSNVDDEELNNKIVWSFSDELHFPEFKYKIEKLEEESGIKRYNLNEINILIEKKNRDEDQILAFIKKQLEEVENKIDTLKEMKIYVKNKFDKSEKEFRLNIDRYLISIKEGYTLGRWYNQTLK